MGQSMILVNDLRSGTAFFDNGQAWVVIKFEAIKMGRGSSTIKVKVRNLKTGAIIEKSFINAEKVEEANTTKRPLQFLYRQDETLFFMDPRTFEQLSLPLQLVDEQAKYLREGNTVIVVFLEEHDQTIPLSIELPMKMEFTVAETDPGVKGDSAVNIYKSAKLDNGMSVKVPLFISGGDKVVIDTRTGEYTSRA